jgi:hypothetical protein
MTDHIPPSRQALREALALSEEVLRNIELSELPLANIALKVSRLACLLNDFSHQKVMEYEASGYPSSPNGVVPDIYQLAVSAGREYQQKDSKSGEITNYIYTTSIEELEQELKSIEAALAAARDPDVSVSSANPNQMVWNPVGNKFERDTIRNSAARAQRSLSARRSFIHTSCAVTTNLSSLALPTIFFRAFERRWIRRLAKESPMQSRSWLLFT